MWTAYQRGGRLDFARPDEACSLYLYGIEVAIRHRKSPSHQTTAVRPTRASEVDRRKRKKKKRRSGRESGRPVDHAARAREPRRPSPALRHCLLQPATRPLPLGPHRWRLPPLLLVAARGSEASASFFGAGPAAASMATGAVTPPQPPLAAARRGIRGRPVLHRRLAASPM